jgi:hypothetical protein
VPPRNMFQICVAKDWACASDVKLTAPVAPPMLSVTILPALDLSERSKRWRLFERTCLTGLNTCGKERAVWKFAAGEDWIIVDVADLKTWMVSTFGVSIVCALTLARSIDGSPPAPKATFRKAIGIASMALSCDYMVSDTGETVDKSPTWQ